MPKSMIEVSQELMETLALDVFGKKTSVNKADLLRVTQEGEDLIKQYAEKCMHIALLPASLAVIDGKEYVFELDDSSPPILVEDELVYMGEKIKQAIATKNLLKWAANNKTFDSKKHMERLGALSMHKFYSYCEENKDIASAYEIFCQKKGNDVSAHDEWMRAIFYGGLACVLVKLMSWIDAYPVRFDKKKKALEGVIKTLEGLSNKVKGTELDYGFFENKESLFYRHLDIEEKWNRMIRFDAAPTASEAIDGIRARYSEMLISMNDKSTMRANEESVSNRIGNKEIVRHMYLLLVEMLMDSPGKEPTLDALKDNIRDWHNVAFLLSKSIYPDGANDNAVETVISELSIKHYNISRQNIHDDLMDIGYVNQTNNKGD